MNTKQHNETLTYIDVLIMAQAIQTLGEDMKREEKLITMGDLLSEIKETQASTNYILN